MKTRNILLIATLIICMPTIACVTNTTSGGAVYCMLQDAIDAAASGDTLLVEKGMYTENILISQKSLTIQGGYDDAFTNRLGNGKDTCIDGGAAGSALTIVSNCTVSMEYMCITNGATLSGGGILLDVSAVLTMRYCRVVHNYAWAGGGLAQGSNCLFHAYNTPLHNNEALGGGAIYAILFSRVELDGPTTDIYNNFAQIGGGILLNYAELDAYGNCDIYGNTAVEKGGGVCLMNKSVGYLRGSGSIIGTVTPNQATNDHGEGGGVYVDDSTFIVEDRASLWGNAATERGGGIFVTNGHLLVQNSASIGWEQGATSNFAGMMGGGVCAVNSTIAFSNSAHIIYNQSGYGGGVFLWDSTGIFDRTYIQNNESYYGGGIYAYHTSAVHMTRSTCDNNYANNEAGAVRIDTVTPDTYIIDCVFSNNIAVVAGAIMATACSNVIHVEQCRFKENLALQVSAMAVIMCNDVRFYANNCVSNMHMIGYGTMYAGACPDVDISDSNFEGNWSDDDIYGTICFNGSRGRLRADTHPVYINNNSCLRGAGVGVHNASHLSIEAPNQAVYIQNNTASNGYGGGLYCEGSSTARVAGAVLITGNSAASGGGIYASNAVVQLEPMNKKAPLFIRNISRGMGVEDGGGAIYMRNNAHLYAQNIHLIDNISSNDGAGVLLRSAHGHITGDFTEWNGSASVPPVVFSNNIAHAGEGGAVYTTRASDIKISDAMLLHNTAYIGGGIRMTLNSTGAFVNIMMYDNSAGIRASTSSRVNVLNSTIIDNSSQGVYGSAGYASVSNCIVRGHTTEVSANNDVQFCNIEGGYATGAGNIDANPLFYNEIAADFRLMPGSPCIDAGTDTWLHIDAVGTTRPRGLAPDIGAFEFYGMPVQHVFPNMLNFGEVAVGDMSNLPIQVENLGNAMLTGAVNFVPAPNFMVVPDTYHIPYFTNTDIMITFAPTIEYHWTQTIVFASNGGTNDVLLIGTGIPEPFIAIVFMLFLCGVMIRLKK